MHILVGEELCRDEELTDIFRNVTREIMSLLQTPEYLKYLQPWLFRRILMYDI